MNTRIKELRKYFDMNQDSFGKRLGVTAPAISKIESGDRQPSDQLILSICREFGVTEWWLREGEGEMFAEVEDDFELVTRAMAGCSEGKKKLMRIIAGMPDELLDKVIEYFENSHKDEQ